MRSHNKLSTVQLAIATVIILGLVPARPASAQILELATGAIGIINSLTGKSKPQPLSPQPAPQFIPPQQTTSSSPSFDVGAGNLNGNSINLCVSGCMPSGSQISPARTNTINTLPPGVATQPVSPY